MINCISSTARDTSRDRRIVTVGKRVNLGGHTGSVVLLQLDDLVDVLAVVVVLGRCSEFVLGVARKVGLALKFSLKVSDLLLLCFHLLNHLDDNWILRVLLRHAKLLLDVGS